MPIQTEQDATHDIRQQVGDVILLTGNCIDRQQLAAAAQFTLSGLTLASAQAAPLARFSEALWFAAEQATSWLRIEGDEIALAFVSGAQTHHYHRTFPTVELIGMTLWGPNRVMLAYYSEWAGCWIDRGGFECERIVISNQPPLRGLDALQQN